MLNEIQLGLVDPQGQENSLPFESAVALVPRISCVRNWPNWGKSWLRPLLTKCCTWDGTDIVKLTLRGFGNALPVTVDTFLGELVPSP